jgi:hypothetical protein
MNPGRPYHFVDYHGRRGPAPDLPSTVILLDSDLQGGISPRIVVINLSPALVNSLREYLQTGGSLASLLRVFVLQPDTPAFEELPAVSGRHNLIDDTLQFIPHFPLDPAATYRVNFDPSVLRCDDRPEVHTRDFSLAKEEGIGLNEVCNIYPSGDTLPENILRFYVGFSQSMRRGTAQAQISVLGPDGLPIEDVLYRAPVELWDRRMRRLTVLLDPGRLKRGLGPNRDLGFPLRAGLDYILKIGSGMTDRWDRGLAKAVYKRFRVSQAIRERLAVEEWTVIAPRLHSLQPLVITFPTPLDWALLYSRLVIESENGESLKGRIAIDRCETQWSFTPASVWGDRRLRIRVGSGLEDVCGNTIDAPFDRPLRSAPPCIRIDSDRSLLVTLL